MDISAGVQAFILKCGKIYNNYITLLYMYVLIHCSMLLFHWWPLTCHFFVNTKPFNVTSFTQFSVYPLLTLVTRVGFFTRMRKNLNDDRYNPAVVE